MSLFSYILQLNICKRIKEKQYKTCRIKKKWKMDKPIISK